MLSQPDKQCDEDSDAGHHMWYSDGKFHYQSYVCFFYKAVSRVREPVLWVWPSIMGRFAVQGCEILNFWRDLDSNMGLKE